MCLQLELFCDKVHLIYLEEWEKQKEIFYYLSHSRPRYLSENDLAAKETTNLYMIRYNGNVIGSVWLEDITDIEAKISIYIALPEYRGIGLGKKIILQVLDNAFNNLKLKQVYLNVRENNIRAIECYKSCGFTITDKYDKRTFSDGSYQGVYRMIAYSGEVC
ncbi:MAG: GNAT family N-acetyltransferase [Bacillota bacterium]|nr:GNAT family N-acetyltransferase [Bacillota bacterium]